MKVLIAIHVYLGDGRAGGSETWATTMGAELERRGHKVLILSQGQLGLARRFDPDLALTAHTTCAATYADLECPKIHTCHGILPQLEQPAGSAGAYVAVSEEVRDHMAGRGFESEVIRNPIDVHRFRPTRPLVPGFGFETVLFYSRYGGGGARETVAGAFRDCDRMELRGHVSQQDAPALLNRADIVVGIGRSALEAMACGRCVIAYDYNGGDGLVTAENIYKFRRNNCSGRHGGHRWTADELRAIADRGYSPEAAAALREYVIENNRAAKIAGQYLEIYENIRDN